MQRRKSFNASITYDDGTNRTMVNVRACNKKEVYMEILNSELKKNTEILNITVVEVNEE
jgi:hypothetical protein